MNVVSDFSAQSQLPRGAPFQNVHVFKATLPGPTNVLVKGNVIDKVSRGRQPQ